MLPHMTDQLQLVTFTHRLIDRGLHRVPAFYRALCAAYIALLEGRIEEGYDALGEFLIHRHETPTAETLETAIELVVRGYHKVR